MVEHYIKPCHKAGYSKKSAAKLMKALQDPQALAKSIVELASVVDVGTPLIQSCYSCESKQPMVFVAGEIFCKMNDLYSNGVEQFQFVELTKQSQVAAAIMAKEVASFELTVDECKADVEVVKSVVSDAREALGDVETQHTVSRNSSSRQRRPNSNRSYAIMNNPASRPTAQDQQHEALQAALNSANDTLKGKEEALKKATDALAEFKEGKLMTAEQFLDHGRSVVKPIFQDYHRLFLSPNGDYAQISRACCSGIESDFGHGHDSA